MIRAKPRRATRQSGFSFVEIAVVLGVVGLVLAATSGAYLNTDRVADRQAAESHGEQVRDALRSYALSNGELPCPEPRSGNASIQRGNAAVGRAGNCRANSAATGWVPYRSLGLSVPGPDKRALYAVYRGAASSDLVAVANSRPGGGNRPDGNDLIRALRGVDGSGPATAAVGGRAGGQGCRSNSRPVAFFVVVPLVDRDGDGDRLDGPHPGICARAPSLGASQSNDDVVIAESPFALIGWLQRP